MVEISNNVEEPRRKDNNVVPSYEDVPQLSSDVQMLLRRVMNNLNSPSRNLTVPAVEEVHVPVTPTEKFLAHARKSIDSKVPFSPHQLDSDKIIFESDRPFASGQIEKGEIITAIKSNEDEVVEIPYGQEISGEVLSSRTLQLSLNRYLISNSVLSRMEHSSEPNCVVQNVGNDYFVVFSNREISEGEKLTIAPGTFVEEDNNIKESLATFRPKVESYSSPLSPELVEEISEYFLYTFRNEWPNDVVCFDCDANLDGGMRFSAKDIYGSDFSVPLEIQEKFNVIPDCPCCEQPMSRFMDTDLVKKKLAEKLSQDAYVSLVRSPIDHKIIGMTYANLSTPRDSFNSEEWGHPYTYSKDKRPEDSRDFDLFMDSINEVLVENGAEITLTPESKILLYNCTIVDPQYRSKGILPKLMKSLFMSFPPEVIQNYWGLGETEKGKMYHQVLKVGGVLDVEGVLSEDLILMVGEVKRFLQAMMLSPEEFKRLKSQVVAG